MSGNVRSVSPLKVFNSQCFDYGIDAALTVFDAAEAQFLRNQTGDHALPQVRAQAYCDVIERLLSDPQDYRCDRAEQMYQDAKNRGVWNPPQANWQIREKCQAYGEAVEQILCNYENEEENEIPEPNDKAAMIERRWTEREDFSLLT